MTMTWNEAAFALSHHATIRMAQRGIRSEALELVLLHGSRVKAGDACEEYALTDRTGRQLERAGHDGRTIATAKKVRAIVSADGTIVTCYHQRSYRSRPVRR
jgi:hypothetical protein